MARMLNLCVLVPRTILTGLFCITEAETVYCAVRTESYIKQARFVFKGLKPAQLETYSEPEIKKLGSKDESLK